MDKKKLLQEAQADTALVEDLSAELAEDVESKFIDVTESMQMLAESTYGRLFTKEISHSALNSRLSPAESAKLKKYINNGDLLDANTKRILDKEFPTELDLIEYSINSEVDSLYKDLAAAAVLLFSVIYENNSGGRKISDAVLNKKWIADENYTQRLKTEKAFMREKIVNVFKRGVYSKSKLSVVTKLLEKETTARYKAFKKQIYTEATYFMAQAKIAAFKGIGVSEYMLKTSGLVNVCDVCDALNGKVFKMSEIEFGLNYPPLHPYCNCIAIVPHTGDEV